MIRPMTEKDIPAVVEIEKDCFPFPMDEQMLSRELENKTSLFVVAEKDATVVGYAGARAFEDFVDVINLGVLRAYRRQGIGRELVRYLERYCILNGQMTIFLDVRESNKIAMKLYESEGFKLQGIRPCYYENGENALVMTKLLALEI